MTVEERLARLERRVSTYRNLFVAASALLLVVASVAATRSGGVVHEELRTRKLVVVDDAGREAASLRSYGNTTAFQMGSHTDGVRIEHGPANSAIQLITGAHRPVGGGEGFQTNSLMLYVDRIKTGMFMINPGQGETFTSHGCVWLDTERGFEMSREMFSHDGAFRTFKPAK